MQALCSSWSLDRAYIQSFKGTRNNSCLNGVSTKELVNMIHIKGGYVLNLQCLHVNNADK